MSVSDALRFLEASIGAQSEADRRAAAERHRLIREAMGKVRPGVDDVARSGDRPQRSRVPSTAEDRAASRWRPDYLPYKD